MPFIPVDIARVYILQLQYCLLSLDKMLERSLVVSIIVDARPVIVSQPSGLPQIKESLYAIVQPLQS